MTGQHRFIKKFDNFDNITRVERMRLGKLTARYARMARDRMENWAPRSEIDDPGYVHFADQFRIEQVASFLWAIVNDKMIQSKEGPYPLWKILEQGTRYMSPRKTIGPVMDILGPEYLREAGKFEK